MTNGTIDFSLGQIEAKLDLNEAAHKEIKDTLSQIFTKLDSTNTTITNICGDIGTLKGKASLWGGIIGFVVSAIMGVASWFMVHSTK